MKHILFNDGWDFAFERDLDAFSGFGFDKYSDAMGAPQRFLDYNNWEHVTLPHDFVVALPKDLRANTFAGARANTHFHRFMTERHSDIPEIYNVGWYRKQFFVPSEWSGKRLFLSFEGIYRDACLWVNGVYMDRHTSGYTGMLLEITDHILVGEENSVAVRVDTEQHEGWWYEGGGIYRNVHLLVSEPVYMKPLATVVTTPETDGRVFVKTTVVNDTAQSIAATADFEILDADGRAVANSCVHFKANAYEKADIDTALFVEDAKLWHVDHPYLYTLRVTVGEETEEVRFGIRTVAFDADRGFLLNGAPLKITGACVHQDFGGVGVALTDNLQYYKIRRLKEMGCNGYRCAHHAPAPALLRACDVLGMLVMNVTRTFGTSPEAVRQLTDLIERDRNHPSVFIWSLGNEEFTVQNTPWSYRLMEKMTRLAKALDPTRPVSYGGNNGPDDVGANGASEVRGVNYIFKTTPDEGYWLDRYHEKHPTQPIIGTEETSYVLSRGDSKSDLGSGRLDSFGSTVMGWGVTPKGWLKYMDARPYFSGSFMWTGFDYRGEPNPFVTTNVSSSFGAIDLCGMEKPVFHYYRAWLSDEPVLKLAPHWNHTEGDEVRIAVMTNCEHVTLYVNGREVAACDVARFDQPIFTVTYEPGELTAVGVKDGKTYTDTLTTAGACCDVRCVPVLEARDGGDVAIYELVGTDAEGRVAPTTDRTVALTVTGGRIVGVGNGDPACLDYEQKKPREEALYLRNFTECVTEGTCVNENGELTEYEQYLRELSQGARMYSVPQKVKNHARIRYDSMITQPVPAGYTDDFRLIAGFADYLTPPTTLTLSREICTEERYDYVEFERLGGEAVVYLNGERIGDNAHRHGRTPYGNIRPYRFPVRMREGKNVLTVVTRQYSGSDAPISGYVKLGRLVDDPWQVRLHFGRARVFVQSETPNKVKIEAKLK